ncbi:hypothetical protein NXW77_00075 [Bacteroides fragilis]|nr:hypothetical protein [Bacteroides fragilis]
MMAFRETQATSYYGARMFYYGDVRADDMQARTQGMRSSSCMRCSTL